MKGRVYEGQNDFLKKSGARFWFPGLTEKKYFMIRIAAALLFIMLAAGTAGLFHLPGGIFWLTAAAAPAGFFFPGMVLRLSDSRDNEQMMPDIRKLFEYVKIQTKAGMYLTNTLAVCYLAVSNRRLKQALLEMNAQIIASNNITAAVKDFNDKFQNEYISQFCMILCQSEESGRMAKMLDDMTHQITDMEKQLIRRRQIRMERKVLFLTLLVFIGIILTAAYQLGMSFVFSISGILS